MKQAYAGCAWAFFVFQDMKPTPTGEGTFDRLVTVQRLWGH